MTLEKSITPLKGQQVKVVTQDGRTLEGWLERIDTKYGHCVLRDATDENQNPVDPAYVRDPRSVEGLERDGRIERVALEEIDDAPYASASWEREDNRQYIDEVRDAGWVQSYPEVRQLEDGALEVVEGHKRFWIARQAGLDDHPVRIVDLSDWEAARRFVADHLPLEHERDRNGYYDDEEIGQAIGKLADRWGERVLGLERVSHNAGRLGIDTSAHEGQEEAEATEDDGSDNGDEPQWPDAGSLSPSRRAVLEVCREQGTKLTIDHCADSVDYARGTVASALPVLRSKGLIESETVGDGTAQKVYWAVRADGSEPPLQAGPILDGGSKSDDSDDDDPDDEREGRTDGGSEDGDTQSGDINDVAREVYGKDAETALREQEADAGDEPEWPDAEGLTDSEREVLEMLRAERGRVERSEIGTGVSISRRAISRTLATLVDAGLVSSKRKRNNRKRRVYWAVQSDGSGPDESGRESEAVDDPVDDPEWPEANALSGSETVILETLREHYPEKVPAKTVVESTTDSEYTESTIRTHLPDVARTAYADRVKDGEVTNRRVYWAVPLSEYDPDSAERTLGREPILEAAADADTVSELADALGWTSTKLLHRLGEYDLDGLLFSDDIELSDLSEPEAVADAGGSA